MDLVKSGFADGCCVGGGVDRFRALLKPMLCAAGIARTCGTDGNSAVVSCDECGSEALF